MFRVPKDQPGRRFRWAVIGLLLLSAAALVITVWVMNDFLREQEIVAALLKQIPSEFLSSAEELQGELRWQFRLTTLVVLNVVVTGIAIVLLWRAYSSSQESLRDFIALAGDILSSMDQAVLTTDLNGIVTSINRRGFEFLDVTGEFIGRPLCELPKFYVLEELRRESIAKGSSELIRDLVLPRSGNRLSSQTFRMFCQPLNDYEDKEIGCIVQIRDATERVLIEERMRRLERFIGLGSLAVGLRHEIKNPLAALSLHVQLLEEHLNDPNPHEESPGPMLEIIKTEVDRISAVLENFRDFASLDNLVLSNVKFKDLLDHHVRLVTPQADRAGVKLVVRYPQQPLPDIQADGTRLEQVLLNLVLNAIEAMPNGGTITLTASTEINAGQLFIRLEVKDTGTGIPEELLRRIFDPYFSTKGKGTGMGLAISEKIVSQHNGSLSVSSSPQGTTFVMTLPVDPNSIPQK